MKRDRPVLAQGMANVSDAPVLRDIADTPNHELALEDPTPRIDEQEPKKLDICMIGAHPFAKQARRKDHDAFAISMRDIEQALKGKEEMDLVIVVPPEYHTFLNIFSRPESNKLPLHRAYDYTIPLKEGSEPPFNPLRGISRDELLVLQKYLKDNLTKGFIKASSSPAAAPVFFIRKPQGGLRFCVDYRGLNEITIKNRYPLPLIKETLDRLSKAYYFTILNIVAAFNRIRLKKGEE